MVKSLSPRGYRVPNLFDELRSEVGQLMDRFGFDEESGSNWFAPQTNVAETDSGFEITLDLPGMKSDEFNVELKDGQLWVTGERKHETEEKGKTWHRIERSHGQFRRVITLGHDVDTEGVDATYTDGVLKIVVPKVPEAKAKRITVK